MKRLWGLVLGLGLAAVYFIACSTGDGDLPTVYKYFAYVTNSSTVADFVPPYGHVSAFAIDTITGALTAVDGSPFSAGRAPKGIAADPSGKFAYVANQGESSISAFAIDPATGALTAIAGSPFAAGNFPLSIAIDPAGKFAYTANAVSEDVSAFTIDAATGALTAITGSPFAAGGYPYGFPAGLAVIRIAQ